MTSEEGTFPEDQGTIGPDARDHLSSLHGLIVLAMLMAETGDDAKILDLAVSALPGICPCEVLGVHLLAHGWVRMAPEWDDPQRIAELEAGVETLGRAGGVLVLEGRAWARALPLRSSRRDLGHVVVAADRELSKPELFRLLVLLRQTAIAASEAQLYRLEHETKESLAETVTAFERSFEIHRRLTKVASTGGGLDGLVDALHQLTGRSVAVEDQWGNLQAWTGPDRPEPYPKAAPDARRELIARTAQFGHPLWEDGRLLMVAAPWPDVIGVLALDDPADDAGSMDRVALEHGATIMAMELIRLQSIGDTELRLRIDLVQNLVAGVDLESCRTRAKALSYDLDRPHRAVVLDGATEGWHEGALLERVRQVSEQMNVGSLVGFSADQVVVLAHDDTDWQRFRASVGEQTGYSCTVGVGGRHATVEAIPRSHHEAQLALRLQAQVARGGVVTYDDLGVYRILAETQRLASLDEYVRDWLGSLMDYDEAHGASLVDTLTRYLECGGNYDAASAVLLVHRNTLKYRLGRIREISGLDISDPEVRFNLELAVRAWQTHQAI